MSVIPKDQAKINKFIRYFPNHTVKEAMAKFNWTIHVVHHFKNKYNLQRAKTTRPPAKRYGVGTVLDQLPLNPTVLDFTRTFKLIAKAQGEVIHTRVGIRYKSQIDGKNCTLKNL